MKPGWMMGGSGRINVPPHYKTVLEEYVEPPMDPAIREELVDFVDRRKAEGGAATDF